MNNFLNIILNHKIEVSIKVTDLNTLDICFTKKLNKSKSINGTIKCRVMVDTFYTEYSNIDIEHALIEKLYKFIDYYNEKLLEETKENE